MTAVLDASALLTFLHDEPGAAVVSAVLDGACISSVNWSEVLQKALQRKVDIEGMQQELSNIGLSFEAFTPQQAEIVARLWPSTRPLGLSLAGRACLALAVEKNLPVLTTDQTWGRLTLDLNIQVVR